MRIGLRILLGYFVIVAIAAILLGRVFVQEVKPGVRQAMEDTLVDTANLLAGQAKDDLLAGQIDRGRFAASVRHVTDRDLGAEIWGFSKRRIGTRIYVTDARGIVVFDSSGRDVGQDYSRWNDVYLTLRGRYGARSTRADPDDDASTVMYVAAPIVDRSGGREQIVGVLTVAKPNQTIAPFIERSQDTILRWGFVLLGAALAIGLLAAWWLSRQLGALRRYADAVTAGDRVSPPDAAGEFGDLGRALATMRERLEGKQYVEQYVHALTHELKSPLAAIRGSAELVESGSEHHAGCRPRALHRHHPRAGRPHGRDDRQVAGARRGRASTADRGAAARRPAGPGRRGGGTPCTEAPASWTVSASHWNAGGGARRCVPAAPGGGQPARQRGRFRAGRQRSGGGDRSRWRHWNVTVADRGPGVPDYALERAFERFYSLPRPGGGSRSSGLGLCFVAEAAALHGGLATLANREGGGAVATLSLPA